MDAGVGPHVGGGSSSDILVGLLVADEEEVDVAGVAVLAVSGK